MLFGNTDGKRSSSTSMNKMLGWGPGTEPLLLVWAAALRRPGKIPPAVAAAAAAPADLRKSLRFIVTPPFQIDSPKGEDKMLKLQSLFQRERVSRLVGTGKGLVLREQTKASPSWRSG